MSAELRGLDNVLQQLEQKLGKKRMETISDEALKKGADVFVKELKKEFESFKDTGASLEEITVSEPRDVSGVRTISVYWEGPKNRRNIIHLNEFGTVKNPNPRGKGAIARALRNSEKAYRNAIREELNREI